MTVSVDSQTMITESPPKERAVRCGMVLSKLDKQILRHILALFVNHTKIPTRPGMFRYSVEEIRKQLSFGSDFPYCFGDFFKLVLVRHATIKSNQDGGKYDTLFYFDVELDNATRLRKDDKLYIARRKIAEETTGRLERYLRDNELGIELR
jgi:hypothetical protein